MIRISVNRQTILANDRNNDCQPVIECEENGLVQTSNKAVILDSRGKVAAAVVYDPANELPGGAKVWIETNNPVKLL